MDGEDIFTAFSIYEGLCYSLSFTEEQWRIFLNHGSTLYDTEFRKMMKFLEDNGKPKYEVIKMRQQMELQVIKHYKITPIGSDLLALMSEEDRERYYLNLYEKDPKDPEAARYYIKHLETVIALQQEDYDSLDKSTTRIINNQDKAITKLKSMNRKLNRIITMLECRNWRNPQVTEPRYNL